MPDRLQVTSTGDSPSQGNAPIGLTGLLWSPTVTASLSKYISHMKGAVLPNLMVHPDFVGLTFEDGE